MATDSDNTTPTRRSLLVRLKNWDDGASWKDFFDTYWELIYGLARQAGLSDAEAQDVVQETVIAVARKMPDFQYDPALGSFKAWLRQLTRWRIGDQLRKKGYQSQGHWLPREHVLKSDVLAQQPVEDEFDLERVWDEEWEKALMEAALKKVRRHAGLQQYQMFYLHVFKRLPAREVARCLEVKLHEVYYAKYKLAAQMKKEIKALKEKLV